MTPVLMLVVMKLPLAVVLVLVVVWEVIRYSTSGQSAGKVERSESAVGVKCVRRGGGIFSQPGEGGGLVGVWACVCWVGLGFKEGGR